MRSRLLVLFLGLFLAACAAMPALERPRVTVADIDDVSFRGMELRMLMKLRVQNPNFLAIDYDGVDIRFEIDGRTVAQGTTRERGSVPAHGEAIVGLPVTVSFLELGGPAMRLLQGRSDRIAYVVEGQLDSPLFGATTFRREGELRIPANR